MKDFDLEYTMYSFAEPDYKKVLTYEEALDTMLSVYKDTDMTRDMLTISNNIQLKLGFWLSVAKVYPDGDRRVLMAGLWNMLPDGVAYDDNCNRIEA